MKHSVSVCAIIFDEMGKVLVIKRRDTGAWEPPGGIIEFEEDIKAALIREVMEETGLLVSIQRLTGVYKNLSRGIITLVFRAIPSDGKLCVTDETVDYAWMTIEETEKKMSTIMRVRVLDSITETFAMIRAHNGKNIIC